MASTTSRREASRCRQIGHAFQPRIARRGVTRQDQPARRPIGLADRGSRPWPPGAHGARNRSNHHYHWDRLEGTGKAALRTVIRTAS